MRTLVLLLSACVAGISVAAPQEPQPSPPPARPVLVDDVPEGANWIADVRTRLYYRVGCPATLNIPAENKLFYKSETSLQATGFHRSNECTVSGATPPPPETPIETQLSPTDPFPAAGPTAAKSAGMKHLRQGFWFNGGLGYGSLGCHDCTGGREGAVSGGLAVGGALSQRVMLGVGTNGWTRFQNGATLRVSTLLALLRFYPSATGGFFLLGGLGLGTNHGELTGFGSETQTGFGALFGMGCDIRVGRNVSLTPFWNGFATNTRDLDADVRQIGLGVTVH